MRIVTVCCAAALLLSGCADYGPKELGGGLVGGGLGGLAGAQFGQGKGKLVTTAAGTLLGAFAGTSVGRSLDRADQTYMHQTTSDALERAPSGRRAYWRNPDSGASGTVTPISTYQTPQGNYCREYSQQVYVGGQSQEAYGTACRMPDGSWRVTN
jgi:surface antigen